jgi:hypothetical protein
MDKDLLYQKLIEANGNTLALGTISKEEDKKVLLLAEVLQEEGKIKILESGLQKDSVYIKAVIR